MGDGESPLLPIEILPAPEKRLKKSAVRQSAAIPRIFLLLPQIYDCKSGETVL